MTQLSQTQKSNQWLHDFASNVYSQNGEDGIIAKVLEVINERSGWCVEFGAWDGIHLSNTCNLIKNYGSAAVLIEGNPQRCQEIKQNFDSSQKVIPINAFVGFEPENCLDSILKQTEIPTNFDLLSIDIDGNDYHIWDSVQHYRPKVVVIEYNPTIPNPVDFVQPQDMNVSQGSSLLSINKLAKQKGYELVAVTYCNGIFVDAQYFPLFEIEDNSVIALRTEEPVVTYIFNGYDGTVFVRGCEGLVWHYVAYRESSLQQIPKWLRSDPQYDNKFKGWLRNIYYRLRFNQII